MFEKFIDKVGLDRIAHFGAGAAMASFSAFMFLFSMPMADGILVLGWMSGQAPFALGYVVAALAAWAKEMSDGTPDWLDFAATMAGAAFVHLGAMIGWLLHYGNGRDLISTPWGWAAFGLAAAAAASLWLRWALRQRKNKKNR